jgi:hypothetical protein
VSHRPSLADQIIDTLHDVTREATAARDEAHQARRVEDAIEVLTHVENALADLTEARGLAVAQLRAWGASWDRIAGVYGTSRQSAWDRFHDTVATIENGDAP